MLEKAYKNWIKESDDLWYMWDKGRLIVNTWHPQQRSSGRTSEYLYEQIAVTIDKIIKRTIEFLADLNR